MQQEERKMDMLPYTKDLYADQSREPQTSDKVREAKPTFLDKVKQKYNEGK